MSSTTAPHDPPFRLQYFAEHLRQVTRDDTLDWVDQIAWLDDLADQLDTIADQLGASDRDRAQAFAHSMHALMFHDGAAPLAQDA